MPKRLTDHQTTQAAIETLLRDRDALKRILPKVLKKADETYPPHILISLDRHRIAVEEARLYDAKVGPTTIAGIRGKSKQAVSQSVVNLVRRYLLAYPELMDSEE